MDAAGNVTVLMSVYNGLPYLPEAVESIRAQTLRGWKMLIVNDGSTDGSADYLDALRDSRISIHHQSNQGLAAALNEGLGRCDTEFLARMDADDIAHPRRLEKQLDYLRQQSRVGLVGTQIEPLGAVRAGGSSALPTDHASIYENLIHGRVAIYHPTIMGRTALMRSVGGYWDHGVAQDWDFYLRLAEETELANLDQVLLSYRIHTGSTTSTYLRKARLRVKYACECARRRQAGRPKITFDDFTQVERQAPLWRRALDTLELHARRQYRIALNDKLGSRPLRGYLRLGWAAACSPLLTQQRVIRVLRASLAKKPERVSEVPPTAQPQIKQPLSDIEALK